MNINLVQVLGRITNDIEMKKLPSGTAVITFSLATNRTWKDKDGEKKEEAEFHNCVAFGKPAELIAQYMGKGNELYVQGRLKTRNWVDKETEKKVYKTEIIVENFQFGSNGNKTGGSKKSEGYGDYDNEGAPEERKTSAKKKVKSYDGGIDYPSEEISVEEIPF